MGTVQYRHRVSTSPTNPKNLLSEKPSLRLFSVRALERVSDVLDEGGVSPCREDVIMLS